MNLHQVAVGVVSSVNPQQPSFLYISTGPAPTTGAGQRVPTFADPILMSAQVQPISTGDLRKLDALNIQGVQRKIFMNGHVNGLVRIKNQGGDVIVLANGLTFLTKAVLEQWPDWVCVAVVLQDNTAVGCLAAPRF